MKNLKVQTVALLLTFMAWLPANSQEHKISMSSGVLAFEEINQVTVTAYDGNEVIIETAGNYRIPERAKGLRPINALGLTDNTGIGLSTKKEGNTTVVRQVASKNSDAYYKVKVPKGVMISYKNSSIHGDDFKAVGISNELEVSTHGGDIKLVDVTGPITANTVHGDIEVEFSDINQKLPSSFAAVHGDVDVALPAGAKSDLNIATNWGEVYSDLDIQVASNSNGMKAYGANKINGTIGGGGVKMSVSSTHGNVYLRKK